MASKRATIIYNPMSGRFGRRHAAAHHMRDLLVDRAIATSTCPTTGPDSATGLAREALAEGSDIIVCYGGDGTINEVIQPMAGTSASLAVWAGGTSNVVARDLGLPRRQTALADVIARGKTRRVALGLASSNITAGVAVEADAKLLQTGRVQTSSRTALTARETDAQDIRRYFVMMAGIGLDASVAKAVNKKIKRGTGELAYWLSGIGHLLFWEPVSFTVEADGSTYESVFTVIGKGKGYGGEMVLTPGASLEEPRFEVFILPKLASRLSYLRVSVACLRGKPETTSATIIKAYSIRAHSTLAPWVEVDGEVVGPLPMSFEVVPDALSLIVP